MQWKIAELKLFIQQLIGGDFSFMNDMERVEQ